MISAKNPNPDALLLPIIINSVQYRTGDPGNKQHRIKIRVHKRLLLLRDLQPMLHRPNEFIQEQRHPSTKTSKHPNRNRYEPRNWNTPTKIESRKGRIAGEASKKGWGEGSTEQEREGERSDGVRREAKREKRSVFGRLLEKNDNEEIGLYACGIGFIFIFLPRERFFYKFPPGNLKICLWFLLIFNFQVIY